IFVFTSAFIHENPRPKKSKEAAMSDPIENPEAAPSTPPAPQPACEPVQYLDGETEKLEEGIALCLSGGGYRAMLFHTGVLWREKGDRKVAEVKPTSAAYR